MLLLPLHIAAGAVALVAGTLALAARKGGTLHRKSGLFFAGAMIVMALIGGTLASGPHRAINGALREAAPLSVLASLLTVYLVATAVLTVRPAGATRQAAVVSLLGAALVGAVGVWVGFDELAGAGEQATVINAFVFALVAGLALLGDLRLLWGTPLSRPRRLARHLWRMCFAMFIATGSFFLGQAKFFPEAVRHSGLLAAPVLLVLVLMVYWLVRLLWLKRAQSPALS